MRQRLARKVMRGYRPCRKRPPFWSRGNQWTWHRQGTFLRARRIYRRLNQRYGWWRGEGRGL